MSEPQILISAGEASSDMYAARLATTLRARVPAKFFGMGGPRMAEAGVELIADYHEVAVVGITEVLHKIPTVIGVQNRLAREAANRRAALAILVLLEKTMPFGRFVARLVGIAFIAGGVWLLMQHV